MNKKHYTRLGAVMILLWVALIFYFSSQPPSASHEQSGRFVQIFQRVNDVFDISESAFFTKIETFIFEGLFDDKYKSLNAKVRKSAHFGIYFVLGALVTGSSWLYTKKWFATFLMGVSIPTTVAVLDEFNQGFKGRTSSISDVMLDMFGAIFGTLIVLLFIGSISIYLLLRHKPK